MIGLDFGTTNSALAVCRDGAVDLAEFSLLGRPTTSFRSILYLSIDERRSMREPGIFAGPAAIEQYLEEGATGRFVQSLKSLLPSRTFESTQVLGTVYDLETLISEIVLALRSSAERQFGPVGSAAVVGRPVEFVGVRKAEDEKFALGRLRRALALSGFDRVEFEYEPVAAAYSYAQNLEADETLLVADFGGGTSDFCVMRVGPGTTGWAARDRILSTDGVGVAGDRFDARIVEAVVAPALGRGGHYRGLGGKELDIPDWLYARLANWHELSFLRAPNPLGTLRDLAKNAFEPQRLQAFLALVEENLGYYLYDNVEGSKRVLSDAHTASLDFHEADVEISCELDRLDFECWIADELDAIALALDRALSKAGLRPDEVDRVFMTGGTAFTPAVREIFDDTFGPDKIASGGELTSVATGLALRAAELDAEA